MSVFFNLLVRFKVNMKKKPPGLKYNNKIIFWLFMDHFKNGAFNPGNQTLKKKLLLDIML